MEKYKLVPCEIKHKHTGKIENVWLIGEIAGEHFAIDSIYDEYGKNTDKEPDDWVFNLHICNLKLNLKQMSIVFNESRKNVSDEITMPDIHIATLTKNNITSVCYFLMLDTPIILNSFGESIDSSGEMYALDVKINDEILNVPLQDREEILISTYLATS